MDSLVASAASGSDSNREFASCDIGGGPSYCSAWEFALPGTLRRPLCLPAGPADVTSSVPADPLRGEAGSAAIDDHERVRDGGTAKQAD